jgi:hypothetical protein
VVKREGGELKSPGSLKTFRTKFARHMPPLSEREEEVKLRIGPGKLILQMMRTYSLFMRMI